MSQHSKTIRDYEHAKPQRDFERAKAVLDGL